MKGFPSNAWRQNTRLLLLGFCLLVLILSQFGFWGFGERGDQWIEKGQYFSEMVPLIEYLGPLAPVALSPFFGIALLSGAAVLSRWGIIPGNAFLNNSETLGDPMVFMVFLALALFTSLPKLTKVTKPVAQAADQLESYAGVATILVLQGLIALKAGGGNGEDVVLQAGVFTATGTGVIMILSAVNLIVINTVKFVIEVLIWLCPIPMIDAIFEASLKAICAGLMVLYLTSPWLSALVNGILFLFCLLIFRWAYRTMNYYRVVLFGPIFLGFLRGFGLARNPGLKTTHLPRPLRVAYPDREVVLPVYPGSKISRFPRRVKAYLIRTGDQRCLLVRCNWRRQRREQALAHVSEVGRGLIANWINAETAEGSNLKMQFSRKFNPCLNALARHLQAPLGGETASGDTMGWKEMSRQMGREAQAGQSGDFRKDLA